MGNALFLPFAKLGRKKTVVYMDGVDWERPKWGKLAQTMLKVAARFAFRWADVVYVDNHASADAFKRELERKPLIITLGADIWPPPGNSLLTQFGLEPENYILFVGLLQPDKGVHLLVEAYKMLDTSLSLVIVGDNPNEQLYVKNLKQKADGRVRFLGFVYAQAARQLFANCYIYVQPSIMEGNSPSLMSAMACGRCVVVNGIEQNLETIGEAGTAFYPNDVTDLSRTLTRLLNDQEEVQLLGRKARERIEKEYNWEVVVDKLEHEFMQLEG
jgi:glycosyltransferase involved in cell wall biosynthesis